MTISTLLLATSFVGQSVGTIDPAPMICITTPGDAKTVRGHFLDDKKLQEMVKNTHRYFLISVGSENVLVDRNVTDLPMLQNKKELLRAVIGKLDQAKQISDLSPEGASASKRFIADFMQISTTERLKPNAVPDNSQFAFRSMLRIDTQRPAENVKVPNGQIIHQPLPMKDGESKRLQKSPLELPQFAFPSEEERRSLDDRNKQFEANGGRNGIVVIWNDAMTKPSFLFVSRSLNALAEQELREKNEVNMLMDKALRELATQLGISESDLSSPSDGQFLNSAPRSVKDAFKSIPDDYQFYGFESRQQAEDWIASNPKISWRTDLYLAIGTHRMNEERSAIGNFPIKP